MEESLELILTALKRPDERDFLLRVEDDILRYVAYSRLTNRTGPSCSLRPPEVTPTSEPSKKSPQPRRAWDEASPWWCCSCHCPAVPAIPDGTPDSEQQLGTVARSKAGDVGLVPALQFPKMSSYHRLLVHHTARRFGLSTSSYPNWAGGGGLKGVRCQMASSEAIPAGDSSRVHQCFKLPGVKGLQVPLLLYSDLVPLSATNLNHSKYSENSNYSEFSKDTSEGQEASGMSSYCSVRSKRFGLDPMREGLEAFMEQMQDLGPSSHAAAGSQQAAGGPQTQGSRTLLGECFATDPGSTPSSRSSGNLGTGGCVGETHREKEKCIGRKAPEQQSVSSKGTFGGRGDSGMGEGKMKRKGRGSFLYRRFDDEGEGDSPEQSELRQQDQGEGGSLCSANQIEEPCSVDQSHPSEVQGDELEEESKVLHPLGDYSPWTDTAAKREGSGQWRQPQRRGYSSRGRSGVDETKRVEDEESPGISHIAEVSISDPAAWLNDAQGEALSGDGAKNEGRGLGCRVCKLCRCIQAMLPRAVCVRGTDDPMTFVVLFGSKDDAVAASSSCHANQKAGIDVAAGEGYRVEIKDIVGLSKARPETLRRCSWEVGEAGKQPRRVSVDVVASGRFVSRNSWK